MPLFHWFALGGRPQGALPTLYGRAPPADWVVAATERAQHRKTPGVPTKVKVAMNRPVLCELGLQWMVTWSFAWLRGFPFGWRNPGDRALTVTRTRKPA